MSSTYIKLPPSSGGGGGAVDSVNGQTGVVVLTKSDIGLGNVNNTSDANKPISTATQTALNLKQTAGAQVTIPDGSAAVPGLRLTTDNDTGLFQVGDGNLSISANGNRKLSIDQNEITTDVDLHVQGDLNVDGNITAANYPPTASANTFAGFDGAGALESIPGFQIDTTSGGMNEQLTEQPNGVSGGFYVNNVNISFDPLQNSPDESWNINQVTANLDINSSGFTQGINGNGVTLQNLSISHQGTGDVGTLAITNQYFNIGNGTDPITVKGLTYSYGFADIRSGATLNGAIQGYGFQLHALAGSALDSTQSTQPFYDYSSYDVTSYGHSSFSASPNFSNIASNNAFTGFNAQPTISNMGTGVSVSMLAAGGNISVIETSSNYAGLSVNPNITLNKNYVAGLNVNMGNVTNYAGAISNLTIQDLTFTFNLPGDNNSYQIQYLDTTTAGNETVTIGGNLITFNIESGVSTATQLKTAADSNLSFLGAIATTISGVGSNAQVAVAATNFINGEALGRKLAADFVGDVSIQGALSFTGGLSIGALQSFATHDLATYPPGVNSIDTLITQPTLAANGTVTGVDLLGINTAMLLTTGDNSSITSSFLGIAALGLPAVVSMGTGATIDRVAGAVFAISLDGGATGGTIDEVDLCRAIGIPNGVTTVTRLKGYEFSLPFGDPGTTSWGFYETPGVNNYFAGNLLIGGTAGSDDTVTNSSVALEVKSTTKAFLPSRMTAVQVAALTAVDGMVVYDTTNAKLQVYSGGSWIDLH